jgi:eukaryotic-like serine/threonine-protein kinase
MTLTGDPSPLVLVERYRIEERIGAGSMGAVWRASDQLLGRTVAVKQLLLQPGLPGFDNKGYEEAKQRILREGRLAARLQHPHTISVFDVVLHDDAPWLVMEYLPSRTLGALLDAEGPIDPVRAARFGTQIADGLAAAHAAGIVHRDIKPGNILISGSGRVKITDFGVSRAADDVQLTRTGMIAGTPAFLAPEIARGRTPTSAADVFALGSTLYAAVDENAYALLYAVGEGKVSPPEKAGPLTAPLMRMLRKDPTERPSAATVRDELATVVAGGAPLESNPSPMVITGPLPLLSGTGRPVAAAPEPPEPRRATSTQVDLAPLPPEPAPPPAARRGGSGRRLAVLAGAVAVVVLLAVAGVVLLTHGRKSASGPSSASAPTASAAPSAPSTEQPVTGQPTAAQLEAFVRDYYGELPADPAAAWAMLGAAAQSQSGGFDQYQAFYRTIGSIGFADGPTATGPDTVRATLRFQPVNGGSSTERYEFTVRPGADGKLIMSSFARG